MEVEMEAMLAEFDEINNAIDDLLLESEDAPETEAPQEENLPSGAYDTGATSSAGNPADAQYFINTGEKSNKILSFQIAKPCQQPIKCGCNTNCDIQQTR